MNFLSYCYYFIATGFFSGLLPKSPGTFGSLFALLIYYFFLQNLSVSTYLLFVSVAFVIGYLASYYSAFMFKTHDSPMIVADEFIGLWIALFILPSDHIIWLCYGFVLFRFFDILKPFPIGYIDEKLNNTLGIFLDDILAGLFSFTILQLTYFLIQKL